MLLITLLTKSHDPPSIEGFITRTRSWGILRRVYIYIFVELSITENARNVIANYSGFANISGYFFGLPFRVVGCGDVSFGVQSFGGLGFDIRA